MCLSRGKRKQSERKEGHVCMCLNRIHFDSECSNGKNPALSRHRYNPLVSSNAFDGFLCPTVYVVCGCVGVGLADAA